MSKTKNHNSILFLTTLGLYLGLVMVGGSPQVQARAATTRNFDIRDEIEFKDDLDNKPDTDQQEPLSFNVDQYFDEVESFISDLRGIDKLGKFIPGLDNYHSSESTSVPCFYNGDPVPQIAGTTVTGNNKWLAAAFDDAHERFNSYNYFADCFKKKDFSKYRARTTDVVLDYDTSGLKIKISVQKRSAARAEQLIGIFNRALTGFKIEEDEPTVKVLAQNTSFSIENDQVFIVTRLPRGSIDSLLRS